MYFFLKAMKDWADAEADNNTSGMDYRVALKSLANSLKNVMRFH